VTHTECEAQPLVLTPLQGQVAGLSSCSAQHCNNASNENIVDTLNSTHMMKLNPQITWQYMSYSKCDGPRVDKVDQRDDGSLLLG
jgi:hypothetical protein